MSVTPTGNPAWVRTASHTQYGGDLDKQNYMSQGAIDARTDVNAAQFVRFCEDLTACVRTSPFAVITYTCNDTSPAVPTIHAAYLMTGVTTSYAGDSPPTGFPSAARNGDGDVTFTFSASYNDAYSVAGTLTISHAGGALHGSTAGAPTYTISGSTVRVRAFDDAGAAIQDAKVTLVVS